MIDQFHDPAYAHLFHLLEQNPKVAEFVKQAELDNSEESNLPDTAFAWPEKRRYPINNPENTALSYLYRHKYAEVKVPAAVDEQLNKACEIYGVKDILPNSDQIKTAATKTAEYEGNYLLPRLKRLNIKTAADVKAAEQLLLEQCKRLDLKDRAEGFVNLVKAAEVLDVKLQPHTLQMAGMTQCHAKTAQEHIEARRMATSDPLYQGAYEKLAAAFEGRGYIKNRAELVEVTDSLAKIDKIAGLTELYDRKIQNPILTIFNTTKIAEPTLDVAGTEVPLSKLNAMPSTFWEDLLGPDASSVVQGGHVDPEALAEVVPTLPLDLKLVLKNHLQ